MGLDVPDDYDNMKADIYAIGVTMYCMIGGQWPFITFYGENETATNVPDFNYAVFSRKAERFTRNMMAIDPDDRPTALEALEDEWLTGSSVVDRSVCRLSSQFNRIDQNIIAHGHAAAIKTRMTRRSARIEAKMTLAKQEMENVPLVDRRNRFQAMVTTKNGKTKRARSSSSRRRTTTNLRF